MLTLPAGFKVRYHLGSSYAPSGLSAHELPRGYQTLNPLGRVSIFYHYQGPIMIIIRPANEEVATKRGGSICGADNDHYWP